MKNHLISSLLLLFSCSNPVPKIEQDYSLPDTWDGAVLVKDFQQKACNEDMIAVTENPPKAIAKVSNGNLIISYPLAHFRCDQPVEALAKETDNEVAILIQPVEMNPVFVAKCDCGYNLVATIPNVNPQKVVLFHRSDSYAGKSTTRSIPVGLEIN